jgi:hypothetical protein
MLAFVLTNELKALAAWPCGAPESAPLALPRRPPSTDSPPAGTG